MKDNYPLAQLVRIKKKRLEEAERLLKQRKEELKKEEEKQRQLEEIRDKTLQHQQAKIAQLRAELDKGTTTAKIESMRDYIKVVDEELQQKEKKVQDQIKEVEKAKERVDEARKDLLKKEQDVEKLEMHKKEWKEEDRLLRAQKEGVETDELGNAMHGQRKNKGMK